MRLTITALLIIVLFGLFYKPSNAQLKQLTYAEIVALNEQDSILRSE
jgi:hypothetical protein